MWTGDEQQTTDAKWWPVGWFRWAKNDAEDTKGKWKKIISLWKNGTCQSLYVNNIYKKLNYWGYWNL